MRKLWRRLMGKPVRINVEVGYVQFYEKQMTTIVNDSDEVIDLRYYSNSLVHAQPLKPGEYVRIKI